ncbi:MAG: hypothetical protein HRU38_11030 [Saccharospirillaceae bacterium]|nr:hypothetical protein [Saccharospirillaceae bacterium]
MNSHVKLRRWPDLIKCAGIWMVNGVDFQVHQVKEVIDRDTYEKRYTAEVRQSFL